LIDHFGTVWIKHDLLGLRSKSLKHPFESVEIYLT